MEGGREGAAGRAGVGEAGSVSLVTGYYETGRQTAGNGVGLERWGWIGGCDWILQTLNQGHTLRKDPTMGLDLDVSIESSVFERFLVCLILFSLYKCETGL